MIVNKYPYTDFHEMNLNWFLTEFKKIVDDITGLDTDFNKLKEYVINYLDNLDINEELKISIKGLKQEIEDLTEISSNTNIKLNTLDNKVDNSIESLEEQISQIVIESTTNASGVNVHQILTSGITVVNNRASYVFTLPAGAHVLECSVGDSLGRSTTNVYLTYDSTSDPDALLITALATNLTASTTTFRMIYSTDDDLNLPELTNIRIGYDDTVYPLAGDAVRDQVEYLHKELDYLNNTLASDVNFTWEQGGINKNTGAEINSNYYVRSNALNIGMFKSIRFYNNTENLLKISLYLYRHGGYVGQLVQNASVEAGDYYNFAQLRNYTDGYIRFNLKFDASSTDITPEDVVNTAFKYTTGLSGATVYGGGLRASDLFDNISDPGVYGLSNAVAGAIEDSPSKYGGLLLVFRSSDAGTPIQLYYTNSGDNNNYYRYSLTGTWFATSKTGTISPYVEASSDYFVNTCVNKPLSLESKGLYIFGDSIATTTHGGFTWASLIADKFNSTEYNYAIGGDAFSHYNDGTKEIILQVDSVTNWNNCDIAFIAAGTNDAAYDTPADILKEKVQEVITSIKTHAPNAEIIFITPIQRNNPINNRKLPMISGTICNTALKNGCSVINGFDFPLSTRNNDWLDDFTDSDGLHPNAIGKHVYANSVINAIL